MSARGAARRVLEPFGGRFPCVTLAALLCSAGAIAGKVGDTAPDFSRPDVAGRPIHLADFRGKVILLNFWASWCGPCLAEMPRFAQWQHDYGSHGLQVFGVAMDDDGTAVASLLKRRPTGYPIAIGDAALGDLYGGVLGLPLTYLIGADGRILARYQGDYALGDIEAALKAALRKKNSLRNE